MKNYKWNGEPVKKVRFGYVVQEPNKTQVLYWYNWEVEKQKGLGIEPCIIPAIEITASTGKPFTIANIAGVGVSKLEAGGMWRQQHLSLNGKFYEDEAFKILEFSSANFALYEAGLENWQKAKDPQGWERMQALRDSATPKPLLYASGAPIKKNGSTIYHDKFRRGKK